MDHPKTITKNHLQIIGHPDSQEVLVFVHGFGTDLTFWSRITPPFMATHRIVLFDNAGVGQSDRSAFAQHHYLNLHAYATDLLEICEALQLKGATMIGHSAGAMIGALASLRQPERFSRLVFIGASPRYLNDVDYHGGLTEGDLSATYTAVMEDFSNWVTQFTPGAMNAPEKPELAHYFSETLRLIPPEQVLTALCAILQSDHRADIEKIALPTLIIQSQQDFFVPHEVAHYLHTHIAGSQLATIQAKGHFPHLSAPEEVIAAIQAFLPAPAKGSSSSRTTGSD